MPRFTVFEPGHTPAPPTPPSWTRVHIAAREDGSELIEIDGWGRIELWPAETKVRLAWARLAGEGTTSMAWSWVAPGEGGGYEVWVVREQHLAACASR